MEESGDMVFTEILDNFIKILENIPGNLKSMSMTLLYFLSTIDIALTIYKNINNPDFNYINWAKTKILKVGFIVFAIKSYEWFLTMVKDFFISIGTKGLGLSLNSNNYFVRLINIHWFFSISYENNNMLGRILFLNWIFYSVSSIWSIRFRCRIL